jgi:UDP-N-acetylglucosamine 4,6-dehydratase
MLKYSNNKYKNLFKNKTILVTGGTGSFGQVFSIRLLKENLIEKLIIFSRDEMKQFDMKKKLDKMSLSKKVRFFIGDIRDFERVKLAFSEVDIVVHAAALKIVDTAEYNPIEFIKTNIYGAENISRACIENNIEKVIALSTDKAVNPVNLYGATKLASDKLFIAANNLKKKKSKLKFSVVRYGNVVSSRGSVIPFFREIIKNKGKFLPITNEKMTRYWITLNESVEFVINSLMVMHGGEIFIPKMPSFRIVDLAKAIAPKYPTKIVGIRPGEKIDEVLCSKDEAYCTYEFKNYFIVMPRITIDNLNKNFYKLSLIKTGKKVKEDFEYNSRNNFNFLSIKHLEKNLEQKLSD